MIDLHSHVLPGLDDGPATLEGSLALARVAVAAGTTILAATPHVDRGFGVDPRAVPGAVAALRGALEEAGIALRIVPGGELAADRAGDLDDDALAAIRLAGGPYLLLECPLTVHAGPLETQVGALRLRGFDVLLAHPERSPALQRDPGRLRDLVAHDVLCSVTAGAFTGQFGRPARSLAQAMLREGLVHDIASDAHDERRRPPDLAAGLAAAGLDGAAGAAMAAYLTEHVPAAILAGEPIPARPEAPRRGLAARVRRAW
ncbi:MAG: Protein-tyrosine-phosphatase [Solirubrobacterales bacterium]|nr:Protein-tyrosine-phosphatase [Solirubrobacterales bacterium]